MTKKILSLLALSFALHLVGNTEGDAQAGGAAVPFLTIAPDARAGGMGEANTGIADNLYAVHWNPAGLGFLRYLNPDTEFDEDLMDFNQVALNFTPWLPQFNADLYYGTGTWGKYFEELNGTVAVDLKLIFLGEFQQTDETGQALGTFNSNEYAITLGYGTLLTEDLSLGINGKFIHSILGAVTGDNADAGNGISGALDIGLLWKPLDLPYLEDKLSLGLNIQNVGPKMTYLSQSDPLPSMIRLGMGITPVRNEFSELTFGLDVAKLMVRRYEDGSSDPVPRNFITGFDNPGAEFSIGGEYWYMQTIALRAGYFYEPLGAGGRNFYTFGAGFEYDIFQINLSFINTVEDNNPLANTLRFSFLINIE
ncbi:MAG: type IX secretion system outer membrane channel protein PorV [Candidatus Kapaibacteriales bacterium]